MVFADRFKGLEPSIIALVKSSFSASEGAEEGARIGALVDKLLNDTEAPDIAVFTAWAETALTGAAIFTRLHFANDARQVYLLSPMAVAQNWQGQGIGQGLLAHALAALRDAGVDVVVTYGDPAFYGKLGFLPLSEVTMPAPQPLSQPEGWIGQSLTDAPLAPFDTAGTCVAALDDKTLW